jgi:HlyD family secretion protein
MFGKFKKFLKKPLNIILILTVIFALAGFYIYQRGSQKSPYEFTTVSRGNVVQEVSVTGRVKSAESVDLAFEKSGKVAAINAAVGDKVVADQILASLNNADAQAQLAQAQATLLKEETTLQQLKAGTRAEEIQIARTSVANAEKSLADAQNNLTIVKNKAAIDLNNLYDDVKDILNDAYVKADDAVNKQTIGMFTGENSTSPQLTFLADSQSTTDAQGKRVVAGAQLAQFKSESDNLPTDQDGLDSAFIKAENHLTIILDFLNSLAGALNNAANLTASTLTSYKYNINLGRTNVTTALTSMTTQKQSIITQKATNQNNINTAETSLNTAKNTLASAKDNLALKLAGSTPEQIAAQEAQMKYALANIQNYEAQLAKTIIRSPISGVVTKQDMKVGEIITANAPEISVLSEVNFQIEANVPEADIAKIKTGDSARVTLDAYGNDVVFDAQVVAIDPAETIIEGVATYKTTLQFTKEDQRIKSGMTANVDILTAQKENVLVVPQRAIIGKNNEKSVKVLEGKNVKEVSVKVGLKGSDGNVEILEGIKEGDKIITLQK